MHIFRSILFFYKKLFAPVLSISILIGLIGLALFGTFSFKSVGLSYIFIGMLCHYFIYEIRTPNEYYFYFNIGAK